MARLAGVMPAFSALLGLVLFPLCAGEPGQRTLHLSLRLDPGVYRSTRYSEPPQMALWIEERPGKGRHTPWIRGGGLNRELGSIDSAARIIKEVHLEIH